MFTDTIDSVTYSIYTTKVNVSIQNLTFSTVQAKKILGECFGIKAKARELVGYVDQNLYVLAKNGKNIR